jgi:mono/diheme cytochrome c family protein
MLITTRRKTVRATKKRIAAGAALLAAALLVPSLGGSALVGLDGSAAYAATGQERPAAATPENIQKGQELFTSAKCVSCHGEGGKGKGSMTADMTTGEWKFAEGGSFDALVKVIKEGLTKEQTGGKIAMPAAASRNLTDDQVTALAAYTWSLSHQGS